MKISETKREEVTIKVKGKAAPPHVKQHRGEKEVYLYPFYHGVRRGGWSAPRPGHFTPPPPPGTYCTGSWVGLGVGKTRRTRV
jgi:hypothetical protein